MSISTTFAIKADAPEYVTIKEAAQRIGVTSWMIVNVIEAGGYLDSVRYGHRLLVSAADVERQREDVKAFNQPITDD